MNNPTGTSTGTCIIVNAASELANFAYRLQQVVVKSKSPIWGGG